MRRAGVIPAIAVLTGIVPAAFSADATPPAAAASVAASAPAANLTATGAAIQPGDQVVRVTAKCFAYDPDTITVHVGHPVVLELVSLDHHHGFSLPDFNQRADVLPGFITRVRIVPDKPGTFTFACDVFCGSGHDDMSGTLEVKP